MIYLIIIYIISLVIGFVFMITGYVSDCNDEGNPSTPRGFIEYYNCPEGVDLVIMVLLPVVNTLLALACLIMTLQEKL